MSESDDNAGFAAKALGVGLGCIGVTTGGLLLFGACCWLTWIPFARFGIASDLEDYETWVQSSNLEEPQRAKTAKRIADIRKGVQKGVIQVPFLEWTSIDGDVEDLIEDRHFSAGEHKALLRLLTRIEKYRTKRR